MLAETPTVKTLFWIVLVIAGTVGLCWLSFDSWQRWSSVFLELLGVGVAIHGILETRYGIKLPGALLGLLKRRSILSADMTEEDDSLIGQVVTSGQGTLTPVITTSTDDRFAAIDARIDKLKLELEAALRREMNDSLARDASLEGAQREQARRLRVEVIAKHPQEVTGLIWIATGILLSGFS
jgi:hypothetical protein